MFQKVITTVSNGVATTSKTGLRFAPEDVERDMAEERRNISRVARGIEGRVQSVEETIGSLVVIYTTGTVKVYHWVPGN